MIASKNPDKIAEIEEVLRSFGLPAEIIRDAEWEDVDETGETLTENALLKARAVRAMTGLAALADDTGLEVDALEGAPGVRTARFAGADATYADNVAKLLEVLDGNPDRSARFRTVVAFVDGIREVLAEGVLEGEIGLSPRGTNGFGYDPVFELPAGRTLAELSDDEKNSLSHRARALRALAASTRFQEAIR